MTQLLRVGRETFDLGPAIIFDGLFSTITYRLEPNGRGSRFPKVMNRLYGGRLDPSEVQDAARELEEIEAGLAQLHSDHTVWSLSDLRRREDSGLPVNHSAANVRDYFVATDGRRLVDALRDVVLLGRARNKPVELASAKTLQRSRGAWGVIACGLLWTIVFYLFFPNWIFTSGYEDSKDVGGPLLWPAGIWFAAAGLVQLLLKRYPSAEEWFEERVWLSVLLILAVTGLYFLLAWTK